ncbi:MAG: DUF835 domain-containing protein [Candidatus Thermoplasmatota archaeon]|nr:DUF835 domain-containing protein [Candidatus Thermoplasmatota archaeon]
MVKKEEKEEERDKQRIVETGKQLLNTIYEDEGKNKPILEDGGSYLVKKEDSKEGISLALEKIRNDDRGYFLSRRKSERIKEKYHPPRDVITYYTMDGSSGKQNFDPSILVHITHSVTDFLEKEGGTAVIDGSELLLQKNTFDKFTSFLDNLVTVTKSEDGILVVTLDLETVSEPQLEEIKERLESIF